MGKLLIWCTLTRSLADRWGWARGFLRDCEGRQNCGNQTISGWKLGSHVGWWPWEWFHAYSPLGWLTGRKQTPGLDKVLTHSHSSLRRLFATKSVNKQVNIPTTQKKNLIFCSWPLLLSRRFYYQKGIQKVTHLRDHIQLEECMKNTRILNFITSLRK